MSLGARGANAELTRAGRTFYVWKTRGKEEGTC
jgi:hypothetical protein